MSRPTQVQKQVDAVAELYKQLEGEGSPETKVENTAPENKVETAPAAGADYDRLNQRYSTLQGMYNADTRRYRQEIQEASNTIESLKARIAAVEAASSKQNENGAKPQTKHVTEDDEKEYGDTIEVMRRAAREEADNIYAPALGKAEQRIAELEAKLGTLQTVVPQVQNIAHTQEETAKAAFWTTINASVPNWRTINNDEAFKAWLLDIDPITGYMKDSFLKEAQKNWDSSKVVYIFKEWERLAAGSAPPTQKSSIKAVSELELQVSPGPSRGATTPDGTQSKVWTRAAVAQFFRDVTAGAYKGREQERASIEADIFSAQRENRIT